MKALVKNTVDRCQAGSYTRRETQPREKVLVEGPPMLYDPGRWGRFNTSSARIML